MENHNKQDSKWLKSKEFTGISLDITYAKTIDIIEIYAIIEKTHYSLEESFFEWISDSIRSPRSPAIIPTVRQAGAASRLPRYTDIA